MPTGQASAAANLTIDVHLVPLAFEHDGVAHSSDIDFHRFSHLRVINPQASPPRLTSP